MVYNMLERSLEMICVQLKLARSFISNYVAYNVVKKRKLFCIISQIKASFNFKKCSQHCYLLLSLPRLPLITILCTLSLQSLT